MHLQRIVSIVYDITNEQQLEGVLAELDICLENA